MVNLKNSLDLSNPEGKL